MYVCWEGLRAETASRLNLVFLRCRANLFTLRVYMPHTPYRPPNVNQLLLYPEAHFPLHRLHQVDPYYPLSSLLLAGGGGGSS